MESVKGAEEKTDESATVNDAMSKGKEKEEELEEELEKESEKELEEESIKKPENDSAKNSEKNSEKESEKELEEESEKEDKEEEKCTGELQSGERNVKDIINTPTSNASEKREHVEEDKQKKDSSEEGKEKEEKEEMKIGNNKKSYDSVTANRTDMEKEDDASYEEFFDNGFSDFQKADEPTEDRSLTSIRNAYNDIKHYEDIFLNHFKNTRENQIGNDFTFLPKEAKTEIENIDFSNIGEIYHFLEDKNISNLTDVSEIRQSLNENINIFIKEQKKKNKKIKINKNYCNVQSYMNTLPPNPTETVYEELQKAGEPFLL